MVEVKKSTIEENLKVLQKEFKPVYGDDFAIKPEGVIDGIAVAVSALKPQNEYESLYSYGTGSRWSLFIAKYETPTVNIYQSTKDN